MIPSLPDAAWMKGIEDDVATSAHAKKNYERYDISVECLADRLGKYETLPEIQFFRGNLLRGEAGSLDFTL